MTERRNPRTPGNVKNVPTLGKTPTLSSSRTRSLNDLSICSQTSVSSFVPDLSMELDLAYNKYLQAIAKKDLVEKAILNFEEQIDDQLASKCNVLRRALHHKNVLQDEITKLEIDIQLNKIIVKLQKALCEFNDILNDNNVQENLEYYNQIVEHLSNCMELVNIKPLETQMDYDKFSSTISTNADVTEKLKGEIKHITLYNTLCAEREKFLEYSSTLKIKQKILSEVLAEIDLLLLKNISDKFAAINGKE